MPLDRSEPTDPNSHRGIEAQSSEESSKLDASSLQPAEIEPQDAHWLRMDPSLTRSVLAKTEEELLGSLAALMRNKVEHEQASRRFAQIQIDTGQAKHELGTIREQIRQAEEELATRLNEQTRINEEIVRVRQELAALREACQQASDLATDKEQRAAEVSTLGAGRVDLQEKLKALRAEHGFLVSEIESLSRQVAQQTAEREQLKAGLSVLRNEIAATNAEHHRLQHSGAEEQAHVSDLLAQKGSLEQAVAEATDSRRALHAEVVALEARFQELAEAAGKAEQARLAEGLPLLFADEAHHVSPDWDPYPLESEFHTDEALDAKMVAKLVSMLPGLEGCLIVKNLGPVLASQMPERIHPHLKVPDRNYHLLFDRLEKKVEEFNLQHARLATFDLGAEALTVAQADQAFVFVNHRQTKLRPGMPGKLASIVSEVAKMYPGG